MKIALLFLFFITAGLSAEAEETNAPKIHRNALKTSFLSWGTGSIKLLYERATTEQQSMELTLGIIGPTHDGKKNNPKGIHLQYAYKFIHSNNCVKPLHGFYVKPAIALSHFTYNEKNEQERQTSNVATIMGIGGYQWARNWLVIDAYWGIGGAIGKVCDTYYEHGFLLWDFFGTRNKYISLTSGIKIGISF